MKCSCLMGSLLALVSIMSGQYYDATCNHYYEFTINYCYPQSGSSLYGECDGTDTMIWSSYDSENCTGDSTIIEEFDPTDYHNVACDQTGGCTDITIVKIYGSYNCTGDYTTVEYLNGLCYSNYFYYTCNHGLLTQRTYEEADCNGSYASMYFNSSDFGDIHDACTEVCNILTL